jgi:excisionase family DNA binding protein
MVKSISEELIATGKPGALVLSVTEAAAALGMSPQGAYDAIKRGDIPHIRIGSAIKVPLVQLNKLLQGAS